MSWRFLFCVLILFFFKTFPYSYISYHGEIVEVIHCVKCTVNSIFANIMYKKIFSPVLFIICSPKHADFLDFHYNTWTHICWLWVLKAQAFGAIIVQSTKHLIWADYHFHHPHIMQVMMSSHFKIEDVKHKSSSGPFYSSYFGQAHVIIVFSVLDNCHKGHHHHYYHSTNSQTQSKMTCLWNWPTSTSCQGVGEGRFWEPLSRSHI